MSWPVATPASQGLDATALSSLADDLGKRGTRALLIVRHGKIVFEWYSRDFSATCTHYTAAMAKGTAETPALLAAVGEGLLALDDRVSDWIPAWREDMDRADTRIWDLATHSSGLENIEFPAASRREVLGWRKYYYDHPEARFRIAIDSAAVLFSPGTDFSYSGVGYYVLSYVVTRALSDRAIDDLKSFLAEEVYDPIEIPPAAWSIGYERIDRVDGLRLIHLGSGGSITAHAAARVGQLFLQDGCWGGTQVIEAWLVDAALGRGDMRLVLPRDRPDAEPVSAAGWWVNVNGAWPSASRGAAAAIGNGHQVTWIDPELDMVVVRFGEDLSGGDEPFYDALRSHLIEPLYEAVGKRALSGAAGVPQHSNSDLSRACEG